MSFFNYFTDSERGGAARAVDLKNRIFNAVCPVLFKLRVHPDTLTYTGLAMLVGVVIWFVSHPYRAFFFLLLYVIIDGLDGSYARYLNRPTQAGAFTDIVADQLGMVVITLGFIQYNMVDGQVGAYYIMIYLAMITFSVLQNAHNIPMQYIFRSKYVLYGIYMIWAFTGLNLAPVLLPVFCVVMTFSVVQSFLRLKRGFYWKYDLPGVIRQDRQIREQGGTPTRFWTPMKFILPSLAVALLLFAGGYTQIVSMLEPAELRPQWERRDDLPLLSPEERPRSVASYREGWLISTHHPKTHFARIYYLDRSARKPRGNFRVPWAVHRDHGAAVHQGRLYLVDRLSRRVYDIDISASLERKVAVLDGSFDTTLQAPVGCDMLKVDGKLRMLISEYMHHYETLVVDYKKAFDEGTAEDAIVARYRNAGFSRGLACKGGLSLEMNSSLWKDLIYAVDTRKAIKDEYLRSGILLKIASPKWRCRDLSVSGHTIALVDGESHVLYTAELPVLEELMQEKNK